MKKRITIKDVAKEAGVSRQTVSRAMNDKSEISPATKERVMAAVQALGYRPNRLAQGMVTQRTFTVGLIVSDITNPFFPEVARGVQDRAQAHNYNTFLCNTDDTEEGEMSVLRSLAAQPVDGIILFAHKASEADLRAFAQNYRPIVMVNRPFSHQHVSTLIVDNFSGAQMAVEQFVQSGHTHMGMIANRDFGPSQMRRVQGFQQTLAAHGLPAADSRICSDAPTLEGGYAATQALLMRHPETTAVFAYNDLMAIGAIRACKDAGRRIPDEVSIIGFDDISMAAMVTPSLSSVHVNKYDIGQNAMARILQMLEQPDAVFPEQNMAVELILRESTRGL